MTGRIVSGRNLLNNGRRMKKSRTRIENVRAYVERCIKIIISVYSMDAIKI